MMFEDLDASFQRQELLRYRAIVIESRVCLAFLLQLQDLSWWRRHFRALRHSIVLFKIVRHLLHRHPLDAFVLVDMLDDPEKG